MSRNIVILLVIGICLVIVAAVTVTAVMLAKKKINASDVLNKVSTGMGYAMALSEAVKPFLPGVAGTVIDLVLKYASQAVKHVEATYKAALVTGTAANDTRSTEAVSLIKSALALEGIQETEQIDKLINTIIPVLVLALPKTHEVVAATPATAPETVQ